MINASRKQLYRLLRWSEKYTKTDMVYLASGGFWLTAGQMISSLFALTLAVLFANFITQETYGVYRYILSIAAILAVCTLPGMMPAITRAAARGDGAVIFSATKERILWSLLGSTLSIVGGGYYFLNGNTTLGSALFIIALTLPFFETFSLYGAYLFGMKKFKVQTMYHIATQLVSTTSLIITLLLTNSILLILLAYFIPLSIIRFLFYKLTIRHIKLKDVNIEETIEYGKHISLMDVLSVVSKNIDKFLLWHFLGPAQLAVYAFAIAVPEQAKGPLKGLAELALPKFAEKTEEDVVRDLPQLWKKIFWYGLFLLLGSLLYILTAPLIFSTFFPQYMESVIYSQIFSISLMSVVSTVPMSLLIAQKKVKEQYMLSTLQPVVNIALFLILIPLFGILGAIVGWTIGRFIMMTATIWATVIALKA